MSTASDLSTVLTTCGESRKDKDHYLKYCDKARAKKEKCKTKMFQVAMSQITDAMKKQLKM